MHCENWTILKKIKPHMENASLPQKIFVFFLFSLTLLLLVCLFHKILCHFIYSLNDMLFFLVHLQITQFAWWVILQTCNNSNRILIKFILNYCSEFSIEKKMKLLTYFCYFGEWTGNMLLSTTAVTFVAQF